MAKNLSEQERDNLLFKEAKSIVLSTAAAKKIARPFFAN